MICLGSLVPRPFPLSVCRLQYINAGEGLVELSHVQWRTLTCGGVAHSQKNSKRVHYWSQTNTIEWLSARHKTVLITFLGCRKPLYSHTEGMCHSSTHLGMSLHMTQFYQAFPCVSTASDKHWGERTWVQGCCLGTNFYQPRIMRHGSPFNCQCLHNSSCSIKYYNQLLSLVPLTSAVSPRLHPLQLLLPDCIHFSCCSLIASASAAAPRLRPLQLSFPDCDFSSSF